jgi:hypothetical protein
LREVCPEEQVSEDEDCEEEAWEEAGSEEGIEEWVSYEVVYALQGVTIVCFLFDRYAP